MSVSLIEFRCFGYFATCKYTHLQICFDLALVLPTHAKKCHRKQKVSLLFTILLFWLLWQQDFEEIRLRLLSLVWNNLPQHSKYEEGKTRRRHFLNNILGANSWVSKSSFHISGKWLTSFVTDATEAWSGEQIQQINRLNTHSIPFTCLEGSTHACAHMI